ncbi:hypothetical protein, partial [Streptomyces antimycoticus]
MGHEVFKASRSAASAGSGSRAIPLPTAHDISGSAMWTSGSERQQQRMAELLLNGSKTAAG